MDTAVTLSELTDRLRADRERLRHRFGVRRVGVFGSFARGEAGPDSDLDILVEFERGEATYDRLYDLIAYLRELAGRDVDVVTTGGLSPYIRPYVERDLVWT